MMIQRFSLVLFLLMILPYTSYAQFDLLDGLKEKAMEQLGSESTSALDQDTIISGIECL